MTISLEYFFLFFFNFIYFILHINKASSTEQSNAKYETIGTKIMKYWHGTRNNYNIIASNKFRAQLLGNV